MRHIVNLKRAEIYISAPEVLARYDISRSTLARWIKDLGFPTARQIGGKRHFPLPTISESKGHEVW
jgi:predicted DNA-binding transcriptional regulator AlpA